MPACIVLRHCCGNRVSFGTHPAGGAAQLFAPLPLSLTWRGRAPLPLTACHSLLATAEIVKEGKMRSCCGLLRTKKDVANEKLKVSLFVAHNKRRS